MQLPFRVLRVRNFRLLFAGQLVSNIGTWFHSLAQAMLVLELTGSGKALGLVSALQFAPTMALGLYGGTLADRLPRRRLLVTTSALALLASSALAVAAARGGLGVDWIYGVSLVLGCAQALDRPTAQSWVHELVGPDDLAKALGLQSITQSGARMLGPALAGFAYAAFGPATCFTINALSFAWVLAMLLRIRPTSAASAVTPSAPAARLWDGVRYALAREPLRAALGVNLLIGCLTFSFVTTITALVRFELGGDAGTLGAAHALNAAGAVVGSLVIASLGRSVGRGDLARLCAAMTLTIAVNALCPTQLTFLLWAPFFGFTIGAYQTAILTSVQQATEPAMLGRISALVSLGSVGMIPIASVIAGFLIDAVSARAAMGLGAAACALGAILLARPLASARAIFQPRFPPRTPTRAPDAGVTPSSARDQPEPVSPTGGTH